MEQIISEKYRKIAVLKDEANIVGENPIITLEKIPAIRISVISKSCLRLVNIFENVRRMLNTIIIPAMVSR
jgi:hypothetical protein